MLPTLPGLSGLRLRFREGFILASLDRPTLLLGLLLKALLGLLVKTVLSASPLELTVTLWGAPRRGSLWWRLRRLLLSLDELACLRISRLALCFLPLSLAKLRGATTILSSAVGTLTAALLKRAGWLGPLLIPILGRLITHSVGNRKPLAIRLALRRNISEPTTIIIGLLARPDSVMPG